MWERPQRSDELYHHGVKGQKWGVRRYQNPDGSLTEEGKKILKEKYGHKEDELDRKFRDARSSGIEKAGIVQKEEYDVIKRGSEIRRDANSGEPIDHRPKYGSLTQEDAFTYSEMSAEGMLRLDYGKEKSTFMYETKNDLKVANGKKVLSDVLDTYGDKKIKTLFSEAKELGRLDYDNSFSFANEYFNKVNGKPTSFRNWDQKYLDNSYVERTKFLKNIMKEKQNEIVENYKKQGYDAIVDIEDWYTGVAEYPVVLLDPSKSLKLKSEYKWGH